MTRIVSEQAQDGLGLSTVAAVVVAAGQGLRAGQPLPKQFATWRGKPVVRHSVEAFASAGISPILVVIPDGAEALAGEALRDIPGVQFTVGGETRQESVRLGLELLAGTAPDLVLIHDAARPIVPPAVIESLLATLRHYRGAIPVLPVVDSLAHVDRDDRGDVMGAKAQREDLRRVQTPQAFHFTDILAAHREWAGAATAGDDAQVAQAWGMDVAMTEGDEALHKLTFASDFAAPLPAVRVGTGYDVHRLSEGEELWLCGVKIAHTHGLAGHSDADVAIHALVDALLGAIGAGDIGQHFPPSDPQWKGAASHQFLSHAGTLVREAGYALGNADVTIVCEAPKIGPHREAMRNRLAEILDVDIAAISVKATTTEKLGFTGRREGIAAQAAVSLIRT
ncbi:bifunctional 2-C-methyl-D-erythritol 4-phosphate cytidylyltransferase/2-C-methyl-D-erythritol 2,4-cyclodiphosphate synthase [Novosphingobium mangrovi (ex Huang et al. 2023)]|uniref:Bifunctional enzyme IspD/IspF n=1 Tax=Novosphingobium mangrovi (ex Huang et al. 2023) TaxID=2976432 RepID=A0ABT2I445_9SPHN|nr:bifunctional 2-C-methyl-D-erythritol 4-phosphate cytidylyltransferase/2-C-methyl-D-erythritol 2,4-cyclodiphosphate synthase [Novosphingobium mangrovi (ex Huang et al. 2023)]MCT2399581.1 bifunctional 2-C-methyl-D-erythritol 4-phosphate cytidylyltransferase/2-C-methyl-D-erythritol 2,4-cyclodiphosphate synthase [Novosphingobium mangrovi (ex Huang et al. 2023)]